MLDNSARQTSQEHDWYCVESDELADDWACFRSIPECESYIRTAAREIAVINVGPDGRGNCPAYFGMTVDEIIELVFEQNQGCIQPMTCPPVRVCIPE